MIITATDPIRQDLLNRYQGKLSESEVITITNGFDRDDFKNLQKINHNNKLTITYTGTFQGKRTAFYFIESLKSAIKENKNLMNDIHIRFIGEFSHYDKELFSDDEIKDVFFRIEVFVNGFFADPQLGSNIIDRCFFKAKMQEVLCKGSCDSGFLL